MVEDDEDRSAQMTIHAELSLAEPSRSPHTHHLVHKPKAGQAAVAQIDLTLDAYTIGRSSSADITIESSELSRQHAELKREHGTFAVKDLDSTNGVFLNGTRIHAAQLYHGDLLQLGGMVFEFREWS